MQGEHFYRKRTCELCGKFSFEKHLGTSKILDGGFTRIEDFEKSGFGTMVICYRGIENVKDTRVELHLCPDCAKHIDIALYKTIEKLNIKEMVGEG